MLNDNHLNPRKLWNTIKSIFPPNKIRSIFFSTNCWCKTSCKQLRSSFVQYFSTVFSVLKICLSSNEFRNLKRNKAAGVDCLQPNHLKDCAFEIASPISFIINKSFETPTNICPPCTVRTPGESSPQAYARVPGIKQPLQWLSIWIP